MEYKKRLFSLSIDMTKWNKQFCSFLINPYNILVFSFLSCQNSIENLYMKEEFQNSLYEIETNEETNFLSKNNNIFPTKLILGCGHSNFHQWPDPKNTRHNSCILSCIKPCLPYWAYVKLYFLLENVHRRCDHRRCLTIDMEDRMAPDICGKVEDELPKLPNNHFIEIVSEYLSIDALTPNLFKEVYKKLKIGGKFIILGFPTFKNNDGEEIEELSTLFLNMKNLPPKYMFYEGYDSFLNQINEADEKDWYKIGENFYSENKKREEGVLAQEVDKNRQDPIVASIDAKSRKVLENYMKIEYGFILKEITIGNRDIDVQDKIVLEKESYLPL